MLIDTDITIAYKCITCGAFEFSTLPVFRLFDKNGSRVLHCRCGSSEIHISGALAAGTINIPCIGCGGSHTYSFNARWLMGSREARVLSCPATSIPVCFTGKDADVRRKVDLYEREMDELINLFGYESYFTNGRVMLDCLNKIHDIAEHGGLYCRCGCSNIELLLRPDRILLKCQSCGSSSRVLAATNNDLKGLMEKHELVVISHC